MRGAPLLLLLLALAGVRAGVQLPCARVTGVAGCIECVSSPSPRCYLCHRNLSPVWAPSGAITRCVPTVVGAACKAASGDPNCIRCDGTTRAWCVECARGFTLDPAKNYRCVAAGCPRASRNAGCAVCNPDATCARCAAADRILVPSNAVWINVGMPETKCWTRTEVNTQARAVSNRDAVMPVGCIEVDTLFKCNQCRPGLSLTNGRCVAYANGNQCPSTLPRRQYCARCTAGRCVACTGSRTPINGVCGPPCRQLFGIGCAACSATACTKVDTAYANGR